MNREIGNRYYIEKGISRTGWVYNSTLCSDGGGTLLVCDQTDIFGIGLKKYLLQPTACLPFMIPIPHFATIVKDSLEGNVLYKGPRCRHRAQQSNAAFMDDNVIKKYAMTLPRINMVACKLGIHQAMRQVNT